MYKQKEKSASALMLALPLTWGYTHNFWSPNSMLTLFNFFGSLLLRKGGGLSTKAVCWSRFWKCDQQKVLQHKASVNWMIIIFTFSLYSCTVNLLACYAIHKSFFAQSSLQSFWKTCNRMISQLFWRTLLAVLLSKLGYSSIRTGWLDITSCISQYKAVNSCASLTISIRLKTSFCCHVLMSFSLPFSNKWFLFHSRDMSC